jgi:hypothetical protein
MVTANIPSYFRSLATELSSQQSRVRDLIGSRHWGHDGRHKELLLANLLTRHLPATVKVATGFVINPFSPDVCSREQDLMVIDVSREGPLFFHGGLAIVTPSQLLATISIKTTTSPDTFRDAFDTLLSAHDTCHSLHIEHTPWYGAFFYTLNSTCVDNPSKLYEYASNALQSLPKKSTSVTNAFQCPLICAGGDYLLRPFRTNDTPSQNQLKGAKVEGLASAAFVTDIVDHVSITLGGPHSSMADALDSLVLVPLAPPGVVLP